MTSTEVLQAPIHFSPRRLTHVNLFVSDLARSLDFYHRVCGLEIVLRQPQIGAGFLSNGNTNHDIGMITTTPNALTGEGGHQILAAGQAAKPGLYHLGWEMEHEFALVKANQRARAAGFRINRTVRHLSTRSLYVFDADANIHEFYADVSKDWRRLYDEATRVSGHWQPGELTPSMERLFHEDPEIRSVPGAAVQPLRFSHAALSVRHLDRMRLFFTNTVGLLELYADEAAGVAAYATPVSPYAVALVLHRAPSGAKSDVGLHHFALQMGDEAGLQGAAERLREMGAEVLRTIDLPHKAAVVAADPDGIQVELCFPRPAPIDFASVVGRGDAAYGL